MVFFREIYEKSSIVSIFLYRHLIDTKLFPRQKRRRHRRRAYGGGILSSFPFPLTLFIYVTCNDPRHITRMILFIRFVARIASRSRARNEIFSLSFVHMTLFHFVCLANTWNLFLSFRPVLEITIVIFFSFLLFYMKK